MSGGLLAALRRLFLTHESFFKTVVENASDSNMVADVMLSSKEAGGIILHRLSSTTTTSSTIPSSSSSSSWRNGDNNTSSSSLGLDTNEDLFVTSRSYIGSDEDVQITSELQRRVGPVIGLSEPNRYLLRVSGRGMVAFGACGSVHRFCLSPGDIRGFSHDHLVAWSASLRYSSHLTTGDDCGTDCLNGDEGIVDMGTDLWNAITSGEGRMCYVKGPGVVYVQSHRSPNGHNMQSHYCTSSPLYTGAVCAMSRTCTFLVLTVALILFVTFAGITLSVVFVHGDVILDVIQNAVMDFNQIQGDYPSRNRSRRVTLKERKKKGFGDAIYNKHKNLPHRLILQAGAGARHRPDFVGSKNVYN
jgi:uncharacterized protein (AIM24 family)